MIKLAELNEKLVDGRMVLEIAEFGDGMRGVALFKTGDPSPIERIALMAWHVEQDQDCLQYADKDNPLWFDRIFGAGELSNQARAALQQFCEDHEDVILAWCDGGDEDAKLPAYEARAAIFKAEGKQ